MMILIKRKSNFSFFNEISLIFLLYNLKRKIHRIKNSKIERNNGKKSAFLIWDLLKNNPPKNIPKKINIYIIHINL